MGAWLKGNERGFVWIPTVLWVAVILFFAVLPYRKLPALTVGHFDKVAHFFEYAILSALLMRSFYYDYSSLTLARSSFFTLILGGGYGIVMELVQHFVPGRCPSMGDAVANITGVFVGLILGKVVIWRK